MPCNDTLHKHLNISVSKWWKTFFGHFLLILCRAHTRFYQHTHLLCLFPHRTHDESLSHDAEGNKPSSCPLEDAADTHHTKPHHTTPAEGDRHTHACAQADRQHRETDSTGDVWRAWKQKHTQTQKEHEVPSKDQQIKPVLEMTYSRTIHTVSQACSTVCELCTEQHKWHTTSVKMCTAQSKHGILYPTMHCVQYYQFIII